MLDGGLGATVMCVDRSRLDPSFVGRPFDAAFLADLPPAVDPCGENGEFHTVCTAGPVLRRPLALRVGRAEEREGFAVAGIGLG